MAMFFKNRFLTISSQYSKNLWKRNTRKPKIIIAGDWMAKAGFEIGSKVIVSVSENVLVIKKAT